MKYSIVLNQVGIVKSGLAAKTDVIDWIIIDYLKDEGEHTDYVWVNYNHLMESLPLIKIKDKGVLDERFKKLKRLGLIKTFFHTKGNSLYFILTPKAKEVMRNGIFI